MAATKSVAAVALLVMATFVAVCSATDLYVQLSDIHNVQVFEGVAESTENLIAGFGKGKVFDYPVTSGVSASSSVVARAHGLFYKTSNQAKFSAHQEDFTILFLESGSYSGTSFSFSGVWVSGYPHEFPIVGGTGKLLGLKGIATLTFSGQGDAYKLEIKELAAPRFHNFLANRVNA